MGLWRAQQVVHGVSQALNSRKLAVILTTGLEPDLQVVGSVGVQQACDIPRVFRPLFTLSVFGTYITRVVGQ